MLVTLTTNTLKQIQVCWRPHPKSGWAK